MLVINTICVSRFKSPAVQNGVFICTPTQWLMRSERAHGAVVNSLDPYSACPPVHRRQSGDTERSTLIRRRETELYAASSETFPMSQF